MNDRPTSGTQTDGGIVANTQSPRPRSGPGRREFVRNAAAFVGLTVAGSALPAQGSAPRDALSDERMGMLVDLTRCIGCRRCEWACAEANGNPHEPIETYDDRSVFAARRSPTATGLCVVNRTPSRLDSRASTHVKVQCMHCEHPPCVSACLVGAMRKDPTGPVTYDPSRCIGCRYCIVACPFERLAYEYDRSLTPRVRKCEMCSHLTAKGEVPACVAICPVEALCYGRRSDLLRIAHERIAKHSDRYVDHVYGETECGGTSFLYLSSRPFEELSGVGLPTLGPRSPAERTESIQHAIFKGFAAPMALAALLAGLHRSTRPCHGGDSASAKAEASTEASTEPLPSPNPDSGGKP